jgi:hypothetical protein
VIRTYLSVGVLAAVLAAVGYLYFSRASALEDAQSAKSELTALKQAHNTELVRARDRFTERETLAKEAMNAFAKEIVASRPVPAGDRLRDAIAVAGDRDRAAATPDCSGAADRSATYRQLLDEADSLLGEGESLAAEFSGAAEQHASEVRLLKGRALADRTTKETKQ